MSGPDGVVDDFDGAGSLEDRPPGSVMPEVSPDSPRPSAILKVADAYEASGAEVLELFREVASPLGSAVFPIHLRRDGRIFYAEVETGEWVSPVMESVIRRAAVLRSSHESDAEICVLGAYPVPEIVSYLTGSTSGALLQLDLYEADLDRPEETAELFRKKATTRWQSDLDFTPDYLPLVEELTLASLDDGVREAIVTDQLVWSLGCFLGETIRRSAESSNVPKGVWTLGDGWGEGLTLDFLDLSLDPVGKARAFIDNGAEDSISFYAEFVLRELGVETSQE